MKKTLAIILTVIIAELAFSCTSGNKNTDEKEDSYSELNCLVESLNRECPIYMQKVGSLSEVKYDKDSNRIDYVYSVYDDVFSGLLSDINYNDLIKITKILFATDVFQQRKLIEETINKQVPFRIIYKDIIGSRQIDELVSVEELKDILNRYKDEKDAMLELLRMDAERENKNCPTPWENGMRILSIKIVNIDGHNYINYDYEIDEQLYQLFMVDEIIKEFEKETDDNVNETVNSGDGIIIMARADCGYRYNYFSKNHDEKFVFAYPASKMKTMVKDDMIRIGLKKFDYESKDFYNKSY